MILKINIEDLIPKFRKEIPLTIKDKLEKEMLDMQIKVFATWLDSLDTEKVIGNK